MSATEQAQIEQQTGRAVDEMSDEELEAELQKRGIGDPEAEQRSGDADYVAELEKLAGLRDRGIITEDEFQARKKQILAL